MSRAEANLLQQVNRPLPNEILTRYRDLIALRREERLTDEEYSELLRLADAIEQLNDQRIVVLAELAKLRGMTLTQVMDDLQIKPLTV